MTIGATAAEGGARSRAVTIGGHTTIPFLHFEGDTHPPAMAFEVPDMATDAARVAGSRPRSLPGRGGQPCRLGEKVRGRVQGRPDLHPPPVDPSGPGKRAAREARDTVLAIRDAVKVPLMIWGSDDDPKDDQVIPVVARPFPGDATS